MSEGDGKVGAEGSAQQQSGDEPIYVNHCAVNLSLTTAELDFGQASETDQSVRVKRRLITSPAYFRQMGELIRAECRRYDKTYAAGSKGGDS